MFLSVRGYRRRIGFGIVYFSRWPEVWCSGEECAVGGGVAGRICSEPLTGGGAYRLGASMEGPAKCLFVLSFVVVEVCGGMGGITKACARRGMRCGPVIELAPGYDVFDAGLFERLMRLALCGRIWLRCAWSLLAPHSL